MVRMQRYFVLKEIWYHGTDAEIFQLKKIWYHGIHTLLRRDIFC